MADTLSYIIKRVEERDLVKGFKLGNNNVLVSHLQFVDDTIIFCEARREYINIIRIILKYFERILGLRVNMEKCKVAVLSLAAEELDEYALLLGYEKEN